MRKTLGNHAREAGHHGTEECRHTVKQPCRHGGKSFDLEEVHDAFRIPNQGAFGGFERAREASITSLPAASAKPPTRTAQSLKSRTISTIGSLSCRALMRAASSTRYSRPTAEPHGRAARGQTGVKDI